VVSSHLLNPREIRKESVTEDSTSVADYSVVDVE
jgi:hypothetical protein